MSALSEKSTTLDYQHLKEFRPSGPHGYAYAYMEWQSLLFYILLPLPLYSLPHTPMNREVGAPMFE